MASSISILSQQLKSGVVLIARAVRGLLPGSKLKQRLEQQREFENNRDRLTGCEIIIRDMRQMDVYPNTDHQGTGRSPCSKFAYKALYHEGIELFISAGTICFDCAEHAWFTCHPDHADSVDAKVVGKILFEDIVAVDWIGDDDYPVPHLYCRFKASNKIPYDEIVYVVPGNTGNPSIFREVDNFAAVARRSRVGIWKRLTGIILP